MAIGRFFVVFANDKPGMHELRNQIRPAHRAYLRTPGDHRVVVRLGGPMLDIDNNKMDGTLLVIEAESIAEVERFLQDDPYVRSGLFEQIEIRPWDWGLGNPDLRI